MKYFAIIFTIIVTFACTGQIQPKLGAKLISNIDTGRDTLFVLKNAYVLTDADKNAIYDSIALLKNTRGLLNSYLTVKDTAIFSTENHMPFIYLLNAPDTAPDIKKDLLMARIAHDKKKPPRSLSPYSRTCGGGNGSLPLALPPAATVTKTITSHKKAVADFVDRMRKLQINFSHAYYLFLLVDGSTIQPKKDAKLEDVTSLRKIKRKLRNSTIVNIAVQPTTHPVTNRNGVVEILDIILVYYTK